MQRGASGDATSPLVDAARVGSCGIYITITERADTWDICGKTPKDLTPDPTEAQTENSQADKPGALGRVDRARACLVRP